MYIQRATDWRESNGRLRYTWRNATVLAVVVSKSVKVKGLTTAAQLL